MKFFYDSKRKRFQKITSFIVVFVFLETNCGLSYGADALALKSNRERPKHLSQLAADVGVPVSAMDGILGDLKGASISQGTLNSDDSKAYLNVILNGRTVSVPALKNILGEVNGETVLVRVDYNVKIAENGSIKDDKRITATLPTLKALRDAGAKIVLMSHLQPDDKGVREIDTLKPVAARLGELLGEKVEFSGQPFESQWDWSGLKEDISGLKDGEILLIENLRFNKGEKKNDPDFSRRLVEAIGAKFFVQDAFGTVHRKHASMVGVPELIENKAAGLLVEREAKYLGDMILNAERPLAVIQGGSKVSTKIEIINNLLNNIMKEGDILILGGALAYTFMKADNPDVKIGSSLIEEGMIGDAATALKTARDKGITVLLPIDHTITRNINDTKFAMLTHNPDIPDGFMGVDIGRETVNLMLAYLNNAKTVLWNGPVGAFDINDQFGNGTEAIAKHLAYLTYEEEVTTIGVGGDTALAAKKYKVSDQITYISTAGGAAMDFLAGNAPGIEILEQKLSSDLDLAKKIEGDFEEIGEISLSYSEQDVRRAMKNRGEKLLAISENLRKLKVPALNGHIKTLADGFLVMANRFSNNGTIKDVIIAIAAAFNEADEFKRLKKEALDVVSTVKWNRLSSDSDQREYRDKIYNGFRGIGAFEISHAEDNSGRAKDRMRDMRNKLSDISAYLSLLELPDKGKKEAKRISDGIRGLNERIGALTYNGDVAAIKAGIAAEAKEYGALIYETKRLAIESILYGLRGGGISVAKDAVDALVRFGMNRNQAEASVKEIASSDLKKNVWRERQLENAFVNDNYDKERGGRRLYSDAKTDYGVDRILASDDGKFARQLALELNGKIGNRGRFEGLFKDGDNERGGWVKRPWEVLASNLPEEVEETAERLREEGVETLGFVAMGGEGSIIGASTKGVINISSTSPRKLKRYLDGRDLAKMRWYIVSKSGGTTETTENGNFLERRYSKAGFDPRKYITYVTDPGNRLEDAKNKDGFTVEYREFNKQTTIGGRNTLVNNPTLLAYAWRNPGKLRAMIEALTKAHTFEGGASDPWIKAAAMATPLFRDGRYKVGIIQPEWIREMQWPWEEQNPEESLGKKNGGFTVYTNRPDIDTLERMKDNGWMFVEFQVKGEEDETGDYAEAARRAGYAVVTIPVLESNKDFAAQAVS
ncbi:MAG: phosphoglycerate kinase, partial [Candidatus Omnitrophica bacterium CG1_02_49_10]